MENIDIKFNLIAERAEFNKNLLRETEDTITRFLASGEIAPVLNLMDKMSDKHFIMSAEMARVCNLLSIYSEEIKYHDSSLFFTGLSSFGELYDRYIYAIFMLRRIEQAPADEFAEAAYAFLAEPFITPEALMIILEKEYFEQRKNIITALYSRYSESININSKIEWLTLITEKYKCEKYMTELARIYYQYGYSDSAIDILNNIDNPSAEVKQLIKEMERE